MDSKNYMQTIEERLKTRFDIKKDFKSEHINANIFARYNVSNEKYIATKKNVLYKYENNEYFFVKKADSLDGKGMESYMESLKEISSVMVKPKEDHMSSLVCGVVVVDECEDEEVERLVKRFKYHKSFAWGFKGWVDIAIIMVYLNKSCVISNKKGRDAKVLFEVKN